ncbi:MAG: MarR family transcriptional regulator [Ascidiaceihabitans sp.]|jgi:DNA-binding MarR family transcriptional regulator|nr:MarR family transcriptional regulator [Ascidiaceihabitans sp.]MDG1736746.1 MarR family transcriptional regulator [Paracoccaceae bacterium]|tara:strand:- start:381 stop:806 length:426 start_codon:yes stop_codon:yes gene_type:complete
MIEGTSPVENHLSYALAAAHRSLTQTLSERLKKHGVQIEAWRILEFLDNGERLTMGRLAELALINRPALSKLVDRMVADGMVHRQIATSDQRQINLLLTAIGKKRMMQIRQEIVEQEDEMLSRIGAVQQKELVAALRNIFS